MTKTCLSVTLALAVTLLPALAEDWTTTDGKTYKNVTVISHDAKIVTISSSDGTATFPIVLLDKDLQKRVQGDNATAKDWTVNGKDYHNVTVGKVEADKVYITYDGGVGTVPLAELPPDLQKRFNYDPKEAQVTTAAANPVVALTDTNSVVPLAPTDSDDTNSKLPVLDGFLGISWGSNSEAAKKTMAEKKFPFVGLKDPNSLIFGGGSFANISAKDVVLWFFKDQLYEAEVDFPITDNDDKTYSTLVDAYALKYGNHYYPNHPDQNTCIIECKDSNTIILLNNSSGVGIVYTNQSLSDQCHAADVSKVKATDL